MSEAKLSLPDATALASRQRSLAEGSHLTALALLDATWLQAWLVGPVWPQGWLILALAASELLIWTVALRADARRVSRGPVLILGIAVMGAFGIWRASVGGWAAAFGLAATGVMVWRGADAASDRPDPRTAFRRISLAFILTGLALSVHHTPKMAAALLVAGLLIAAGLALSAARWLEMSDRRTGVSGVPVLRASGQLVGMALTLVAGMILVLTPKLLSVVVLRPLGWLGDRLAGAIAWLMQPFGWLAGWLVGVMRAHASPQVLEILNNMVTGAQDGEQTPSTLAARMTATVSKYLSIIVFAVIAIIVYRAIVAALERRRAAAAPVDGAVTVTRLSGVAAAPARRTRVTRRAPEPLDGTAAGQVRAAYRRLLAATADSAVARAASESPARYATRLASAGAPADDVATLTEAYEAVRYGGERPPDSASGAARTAVERIIAAVAPSIRRA